MRQASIAFSAIVLVVATLWATLAGSQQPLPTPRLPPAAAERITPLILGATLDARAGVDGSACRAGSPPSTTIRIEADATVPAASAPRSTRYEALIDGVVVASGTINFGRLRRPDGGYASDNSIGRLSTSITRTVWNETKTVTVRLPDLRMSSNANYVIECLRAVTPGAGPPGSLALPDLAFESLLSIALYRGPPDSGVSESIMLRDLSGTVQLWDTRLCRGHNSAWVIANLRPGLVNRGAIDVTQPVDMAFAVERAPESVFESVRAIPRSRYFDFEVRFLERTVDTARAAMGGGEAALDHVARYSIPASYFPRGAARGRDADTGRERSYVSQYNNADAALPCGGPRRLTIILDPNNVIRENNETNNTMTITYQLLG